MIRGEASFSAGRFLLPGTTMTWGKLEKRVSWWVNCAIKSVGSLKILREQGRYSNPAVEIIDKLIPTRLHARKALCKVVQVCINIYMWFHLASAERNLLMWRHTDYDNDHHHFTSAAGSCAAGITRKSVDLSRNSHRYFEEGKSNKTLRTSCVFYGRICLRNEIVFTPYPLLLKIILCCKKLRLTFCLSPQPHFFICQCTKTVGCKQEKRTHKKN